MNSCRCGTLDGQIALLGTSYTTSTQITGARSSWGLYFNGGSSAMNVQHVNLLASRILRWLLYCSKTCSPLSPPHIPKQLVNNSCSVPLSTFPRRRSFGRKDLRGTGDLYMSTPLHSPLFQLLPTHFTFYPIFRYPRIDLLYRWYTSSSPCFALLLEHDAPHSYKETGIAAGTAPSIHPLNNFCVYKPRL